MNIYVGNISHNTPEDAIKAHFEAFGQVESVKIIKDFDTGYSKGFGFVEMPNSNEANEAIEKLNSSDLNGNTITVNEARPRTERSSGGGGGGYRGGNSGGGGGYGNNRGGNSGGGKRW